MKSIRLTVFAFIALLASALFVRADLPAPERLAGRDATVIFTVPDWSSAVSAFKSTASGRLLEDPAMKPLIERIKKDFRESISAEMSEKDQKYLDEFLSLLEGQITVVLDDLSDIGKNPEMPPLSIIFDVKDKAGKLADFMNRSIEDEDELQVVREKVAGGEVFSMISKDKKKKAGGNMYVGISGSMLAIAFEKEKVANLIRRKNGDLQNSLADNPTFRADHARFFRNAKGYLWANVEELMKLARENSQPPAQNQQTNPFAMAMDPMKMFNALGLMGWKSFAMASDFDSQGADVQAFLNVPETGRKGLFKLFETSQQAAGPLPFVAGDVAKFMRWRKSGQDLLNIIERTMAEAVPPFAGFISMMIDQAGKTKDPNFNFRQQFIGNLGDDMITVQRTPKEFTLESLASPPTLYFIASSSPDALLDALVTAQSSMGIPGMKANNEEYLGKRIVAMPAGVKMGPGGKPAGPKSVYVTAARGYMVIGSERALVEDFIRGGNPPRGLTEVNGFRRAAEQVGGLGTGWFFYENPADTLNMLLTSLKKDPNVLQRFFGPGMFNMIMVNPNKKVGSKPTVKMEQRVAEYIKLLPDFNQIAKYLNFTVGSVSSDASGILLRSYTPDKIGR